MVSASFIEQVNRADQEITLLINSLSWSWTDWFWVLMSDIKFWIPAYLLCAFFLFERLGWKRALIVLAAAAIGFLVCDQLSTLVKNYVVRLRPNYTSRMLREGLTILEKRGGFYGFFSAHAANSFSLAVCLILGYRIDRTHSYKVFSVCALLWAALVSLSRIIVGKHFFGDILVGSIVGVAIGYSVGMLAGFIIRKYIDGNPTVQEGLSPS